MNSDRYLIDSSVWIFALRLNAPEEIRRTVEELMDRGDVLMHPIIRLELRQGARGRKEFERLGQLFAPLDSISLDRGYWETSERLAYELRRGGLNIPVPDILIAAGAVNADALLVHADRHYQMIAGVEPRLRNFSLLDKLEFSPMD